LSDYLGSNYRLWFPVRNRHTTHFQLVVTTPPAVEPVTYTQCKAWAKVEHPEDDQIFTTLITQARQEVENHLQRALITQTVTLYMDAWGNGENGEYELRCPPIQSVTSVNYADPSSGDTVTIPSSNYIVDNSTEPCRIRPAYDMVWPPFRTMIPNPVWTVFVAGYGDTAASVPAGIIQGIIELVAFRYRNREVLSMGAAPKDVEDFIFRKLATFKWGAYP
jgi:uncharacterized phiE125 gp8 family phage protein